MIKIHTRLLKRLLALGFMCFIANQALAYEKSGFFVGIQGSKTNYKVVEKIDSAHSIVGTQIFSEGHLAGVSCETKTSTSSKWGGLVDKTTVTTTCKPGSSDVVLDGNSSITLLMDTITNFVNSNNNTFGGVIGYKHFFAEEMDYGQFNNFVIPLYKFGYRIYLVYDFGKVADTYKNNSFNINFDALYNFFPEAENFDLGAFVGFSLGYTNYDMKTYKVKGTDAAINTGVRLTFFKNYNLEFFGRIGLSKAKYSDDTAGIVIESVQSGPDTRVLCSYPQILGGSWGVQLNKDPHWVITEEQKAQCIAMKGTLSVIPLNSSRSELTAITPIITDKYEEITKPYQIGIRFTYTF